MTKTFKLSLIALSVGAFFAGAAQAQDNIHVATLGKDPKVVHADFIRAAREACNGESTEISYTAESPRAYCVRATVAKAEADYRQMKGVQVALARGE